MAAPIQQISRTVKTQQEKEADSLQGLLSIVAQNRESLEETILLLQELHESKILEALRAMLVAREQITSIMTEQALRPEAITLINNLMNAAGAAAKLDPEVTGTVMRGLAEGMAEGSRAAESTRKMRVVDVAKAFKDPHVRRAVQFGIGFLKGLGKSL